MTGTDAEEALKVSVHIPESEYPLNGVTDPGDL